MNHSMEFGRIERSGHTGEPKRKYKSLGLGTWFIWERRIKDDNQELWVDTDVLERRDMYNFGYIWVEISGRPLDVTHKNWNPDSRIITFEKRERILWEGKNFIRRTYPWWISYSNVYRKNPKRNEDQRDKRETRKVWHHFFCAEKE